MEYITRIKVNGERKEISPEEASEILKKTVEDELVRLALLHQNMAQHRETCRDSEAGNAGQPSDRENRERYGSSHHKPVRIRSNAGKTTGQDRELFRSRRT